VHEGLLAAAAFVVANTVDALAEGSARHPGWPLVVAGGCRLEFYLLKDALGSLFTVDARAEGSARHHGWPLVVAGGCAFRVVPANCCLCFGWSVDVLAEGSARHLGGPCYSQVVDV
jgi:hypothetical protein